MNRRTFMALTFAVAANTLCSPVEAKPSMNILVLTGSPRKNGNSSILADHFIKGAEDKGHKVTRFDAGLAKVHPCTGCNSCGMDGPCIFEDDFSMVRDHLVQADLVALVSPMYYFGLSAQLKTVIDRFYALNGKIHVPKKAVLMVTYADNSPKKEHPINVYYEMLLDYLGWTDAGRLFAHGLWPLGAVKSTNYPAKAYALGQNL